MAGDMSVFVRLFLKDDLSPAARKAKDALKPMEQGWRNSATRLKTTMTSLKRDLDTVGSRAGAGGVAGARQFEGAWLSAFSRVKAAASTMGASLAAANARAAAHVGQLSASLAAEREAMRATRLEDYRTRPLATARGEYQAARSSFMPYALAATGIVAAPLLPAQHQQHASSRIKMITDMDNATRKYFDRQMLKLTERNIYDLGHTYDAAELAARLSVYEDGVKKFGDTKEGRRKAADKLVHWVDLTEQYSMMWKTMPEETSEKLKFIKNQFRLDFDGVERVADINSALGHKFGFKQSAMVDYLVNAGAALDAFGFTPAQSIAVGSGALRKGVNPSTTGTNLSQILNYLTTARSKGAAGDFKSLLGIGQSQFFDMTQKDAWQAFSLFMEKAGPALKTKEGRAQLSNLVGSRQLRHLTQFTMAWEDIKRAYAMAQDREQVEGYAARKAKEFREDSLENEEKTLWNTIKSTMALIGEPWVEPLKGWVKRRRDRLVDFNDWMRDSAEKGGLGHKAVSYGALAIGAGAGIAASLALLRAAGRHMGYQVLSKAPGLFKMLKWPAKLAWGLTSTLGAGLVGGIAAGSAGIVRMIALTHRFAGAWGVAKFAARGALRFMGIGLALDGLGFAIQNWEKLRRYANDPLTFSVNWPDAPQWVKWLLDPNAGGIASLDKKFHDARSGFLRKWTPEWMHGALGVSTDKKGDSGVVGLPPVTVTSDRKGIPLPVRKPDLSPPLPFRKPTIGPQAASDLPAANDNWRAQAWRRAAGVNTAPNAGGALARARSFASGPEVPTILGQSMAGAQGQAPAGVTINAQGPQVVFRQAPPSISISAPISITMNGSDPNAVGAAVSSHLNSVARGALHDGVTE